ncbi:MAG: threonine--tRNA ligase [Nanoarchaeota archaeon]
MKILLLHCDYIRFKALKKALKSVEELSEKDKKEHEVKECLVVLSAVEKGDGVNIVPELVKNIKEVAGSVKAKNIVLYPYAHLSRELSDPETAVNVLIEAEKVLSKEFKVSRAPFGYYKEFELKVKGHPLSELSRQIGSSVSASKAPIVHATLEKEKVIDTNQLLREITKAKLDTSKLKDNDHRIVGGQMDLFSFSDVAPGMPFWHHNGLVIKNELINFMREVMMKHEYKEISTPQIMDKKLWQVSGHWDKYKENNFVTKYENRDFLVKPMNCPGGVLVYRTSPKSYKELPLRMGEFGVVHRQELSGVLAGLLRVVEFTQDDAHIFCTEEQLEDEVVKLIDLINLVYEKFNIGVDHYELSTRPEKRIGSDDIWDKAESVLESALKRKKIKFKLNKGDGAFYGPKIDVHIKDSLGRTWQCSTIQLDFSFPERFQLEYVDKDNSRKRPVMLHRVIYGSVERFIGILLEHTNGRLPTWLAPIQTRIISFTDRNMNYAQKIVKKIGEEIPNIRLDADFRQNPVPGKVRDAEIMRIPYVIVVGDKEEKEKTVAVRTKGGKVESMKVDVFIEKLKKEISERK